MILDTFVFADPGRSFELNPTEIERFRVALDRVILGRLDVRDLLRKRPAPPAQRRPRLLPQISFDNQTSAHDTIFHVIAPDRPGLLYDLASTFSFQQCDIDVVLIDTEAYKAIDVFYVTSAGQKLNADQAELLCAELHQACSGAD